jgi:hypothetical protein
MIRALSARAFDADAISPRPARPAADFDVLVRKFRIAKLIAGVPLYSVRRRNVDASNVGMCVSADTVRRWPAWYNASQSRAA